MSVFGFDPSQLQAAIDASFALASSPSPPPSHPTHPKARKGKRKPVTCSTCGGKGHNKRGHERAMKGTTKKKRRVAEVVVVDAEIMEEGPMTGKECSICLDPIAKKDAAAKPCGHLFHYHCMLSWESVNPTCAVCKA